MYDIEPEVRKVGFAGDETIDTLGLGDGGDNGHKCLDSWVLEYQEPHPAVPDQTIDGLRLLLPPSPSPLPTPLPTPTRSRTSARSLRHLERSKKQIALAV